ncbi:MAG: hypothetical protein AAGD92_08995 [Pseudomonadota bacterium]
MSSDLNVVHSFLVKPMKGTDGHKHLGGTRFTKNQLSAKSNLNELFSKLFDNAEKECRIEIALNANSAGAAKNDFRDLLINYIKKPTLAAARKIATRLESVTTNRSSQGLLFLASGKKASSHKVVVARFPAEEGIRANQGKGKLTLEFLEEVFLKSHRTYKSALFVDSSLTGGFWSGWAVDKQLNSQDTEMSNYWITDFLAGDFKNTAAAGSKMLATALREASKIAENIEVQNEIASAATLAKKLAGKMTSVNQFAKEFGLSDTALALIRKQFPKPSQLDVSFQLDISEFQRHAPRRTMRFNNGASVSADTEVFDKVFEVEELNDLGKVRVTAEGVVQNQKLSKSK